MRLPPHHGRRDADVAMTPMIDVVFLLLIFFVCTASFQIAEEILPANLLAAGTTGDPQEEPPEPLPEEVIVRLAPEGTGVAWSVDGRDLASLAELGQVLTAVARIDPQVPVILDSDGLVALGHVIDVYDLCRAAGLERIQFAASGSG